MRLLSEVEFRDTFAPPMTKVDPDGPPPVDFWPYFDAIPPLDFATYDCSQGIVEMVYRDGAARFEHVLVSSQDAEVFMVLVIDLQAGRIFGHHLLNLRVLYGTNDAES